MDTTTLDHHAYRHVSTAFEAAAHLLITAPGGPFERLCSAHARLCGVQDGDVPAPHRARVRKAIDGAAVHSTTPVDEMNAAALEILNVAMDLHAIYHGGEPPVPTED